jgi:hypothetical protein
MEMVDDAGLVILKSLGSESGEFRRCLVKLVNPRTWVREYT